MTAFFDAWDSSRRRTSHRCTGPSLSSRSPAARRGSWVVSEMRVNEGRGRGVGARERGGGGARSQISLGRPDVAVGSGWEVAGRLRGSHVCLRCLRVACPMRRGCLHLDRTLLLAGPRGDAPRVPASLMSASEYLSAEGLAQNYFCSAHRADALATSQLRDDVHRGAPTRGCMESS